MSHDRFRTENYHEIQNIHYGKMKTLRKRKLEGKLFSAFGDCAIIHVEMWPLSSPRDRGNISLITHLNKNVLQKRSPKPN